MKTTKEKLSKDLKSELEQLMRDKTDNAYWRLGSKELKSYGTPIAKT